MDKIQRIIENRVKSRLIQEDNDPYRGDGWDKTALENTDLFYFFDKIEEVIYEVKNARRGTYCKSCGKTYYKLSEFLKSLSFSLNDIADQVRHIDEDLEDQDVDDEDY